MGQTTDSTADKLNKLYGEFLNCKVTPCIVSRLDQEGMTIADVNELAFALAPPVATRLTLIPPAINNKEQIGVIRQIIGLAHSYRIAEDQTRGLFSLALLKNSMLAQAAQYFNIDPEMGEYDWTFKYPNGTFFRDCDNVAGYELRLYIFKKNIADAPKIEDNIEINRKLV